MISESTMEFSVREFNANRAVVLAEIPFRESGDVREIVGKARGPFSSCASTLAADYPLRQVSPGSSTACAIVVDPCPWSPEQPFLYEVHATVHFTKGYVLDYSGMLGIRHFVAHGKNLFLNTRRYVIRGIYDHGPVAEVGVWRQYAQVRVVRNPRPAVIASADREGLMVVYRLRKGLVKPAATLGHISSASTAMVVVPREISLPSNARSLATNLLLAQEVSRLEELQPWAHAAWMQVDNLTDFASRSSDLPVPIIAERRYHGTSLAEARAAIDQLQADLAPIGQFAGYVV